MATERFSLIVDNQVKGVDDVDRLNAALDRYDKKAREIAKASEETADRVSRSALKWAEAAGSIYLAGKAFATVGSRIVEMGRQISEHNAAVQTTVNTYRALRVAQAAIAGSLGTTVPLIGAGLLVEAGIATAYRRSTQIQGDAYKAAIDGTSFQQSYGLGQFSRITGKDASFLSGGPDISQLAGYATALKGIDDAFERSRRAAQLFGADGEKALALMGPNFEKNIAAATRMASVMDGPTRESVGRLKRDLDGLGSTFDRLFEGFSRTAAQFAQGLTIGVARARDAVERGGANDTSPDAVGARLLFDAATPRVPTGVTDSLQGLALSGPRYSGNVFLPPNGNAPFIAPPVGVFNRSASRIPGVLQSSSDFSAYFRYQARPEQQLAAAREQLANIGSFDPGPLLARIKQLEHQVYMANLDPETRRALATAGQTNTFVPFLGSDLASRYQTQFAPTTLAESLIVARNANLGRGDVLGLPLRTVAGSLAGNTYAGMTAGRPEEADKIAEMELKARERILQLTAGPGGELAAAQRIYEIRKAAAKTDLETAEARLDYETSIAEIAASQRRDRRNTAGSVFDAITAGRGGIRQYSGGFLLGQGRTIFQNLYEQTAGSLGGKLSLTSNPDSFLGKALAGTSFGADAKQLTAAELQLRAASMQLAAAGGRGGGSVAAVLGGASGLMNLPGLSLSTSTSSAQLASVAAGRGLTGIDLGANNIPGYTPATAPTGMSRLGRGIAGAGAIAGAAIGTYTALQSNNTAAKVLGTGSALSGGVAGLLMAAGVSGPAAPILAGAALALGLGTMLLGDPKKKYAASERRMVEAARYAAPSGVDYFSDIYGGTLSSDYRGGLRATPIIINVSAIDTNGVGERVRDAIREYPPLAAEMRQTLAPA